MSARELNQKVGILKGLAAILRENLLRPMSPSEQKQNSVVASEILEIVWEIDSITSEKLSDREEQVRKLVVEGISNQEIASKLFVDEKTVKFHLSSIFKKLRVKNRGALIVEHYRDELARAKEDQRLLREQLEGQVAGGSGGRGTVPGSTDSRDGRAGSSSPLTIISSRESEDSKH